MTFTYAGDMSSTREILRFTIADTDTADANKQIFTDEELDGLITSYGTDINYLAAKCMTAIASSMSRIAILIRTGAGDFSTDRKAVAKECRDQAKHFMELYKDGDGTPYATEIALEDPDITRIDDYEDPDINREIELSDLND